MISTHHCDLIAVRVLLHEVVLHFRAPALLFCASFVHHLCPALLFVPDLFVHQRTNRNRRGYFGQKTKQP